MKLIPFDAAEELKTEEDVRLFWEACLREAVDCPEVLVAALREIARARNKMQLAKEVGISRQSLYNALSPEGNPSFVTVMHIISALGLKLHTSSVQS
jgi:probable addiction module antidote protein